MNASPSGSVAKLCDARFRGMETQDVGKKETQNEGGGSRGGTDGKGGDAGIRGKGEGRFGLEGGGLHPDIQTPPYYALFRNREFS